MNTQQTINEVLPPVGSAFWNRDGSIDTSQKYSNVCTAEVTQFFRDNGFYVTNYQEAGVFLQKNLGKTKHIVRLRRIEDAGLANAPEILITNSSNKYTSLVLNIGIFRLVCTNGLVMGEKFFQEKLRHVGNTEERLKQILLTVQDKFEEVHNTIFKMQQVNLDQRQTLEFITRALEVRFKKSKYKVELTPNDVYENLKPQRQADIGTDIYTIMNVLQERMIKGGFKYQTFTAKGKKIVKKETKPIKSLSLIADINKGLMDLAMNTTEVMHA